MKMCPTISSEVNNDQTLLTLHKIWRATILEKEGTAFSAENFEKAKKNLSEAWEIAVQVFEEWKYFSGYTIVGEAYQNFLVRDVLDKSDKVEFFKEAIECFRDGAFYEKEARIQAFLEVAEGKLEQVPEVIMSFKTFNNFLSLFLLWIHIL